MNAMSHPPMSRPRPIDAQSDARTELGKHARDLRIHALIMLLTGALLAYSGFRLLDVGSSLVGGQHVLIGMAQDVLSLGALAVFAALAGFCLIEAHRCWKKAQITRARMDPPVATQAGALKLPFKAELVPIVAPIGCEAIGPRGAAA
jgi:hypothetical protein